MIFKGLNKILNKLFLRKIINPLIISGLIKNIEFYIKTQYVLLIIYHDKKPSLPTLLSINALDDAKMQVSPTDPLHLPKYVDLVIRVSVIQ